MCTNDRSNLGSQTAFSDLLLGKRRPSRFWKGSVLI
jgi:hypothetical protein